ncbi:putative indole-3-pyruvate monooxygenase YUCCA10 [Bidens hawaiensis]|uniref:putative indole-3-pyruvate monooxygenase YUCCA10 n=1 Tax=Bidens hawaiensis TaxID=980011 RepID=UPI00404B8754
MCTQWIIYNHILCDTKIISKSQRKKEQETIVLIVGAGPAGIATSACLILLSIPNIVLEREDCYACLWQKKAYDRLKLHLAKNFCQLPHMAFLLSVPTFVPKNMTAQKWVVTAKNRVLGLVEEYVGEFLVVATSENSEAVIPNIYGLDNFKGLVIHPSEYENGNKFGDEKVLVVGAGNSSMEIAYDLCNWGAQTSIVIRSPKHVLTKELGQLGMMMGSRLFNEKGMPKHKSPYHWKGEHGLYCVGFASAGLFGISNDAKNIANDIFH